MIALLLSIVFFILSLIHFHWALGGSMGFDAALPTDENGQRILNPRKIDSTVVGIGLGAFGLFYLCHSDIILCDLPVWMSKVGLWLIPVIFLIRGIGDFKYIGLFKKVKGTTFATMDTKLYTPLCWVIFVLGIL